MKSIRFTLTLLLVSVAGSVLFAAPRKTKDAQPVEQTARFPYDTVAGDPLKSRIYTLPNGLKVHTTVNKREPRIYTMIGVRVGGKNDPAETTGLAHYFEHMMFKGTPSFGTVNYEAEKPLLDEIENLFELYRQTTDSVARAEIYHRIDSISYEASKLAIPNEYDKMMAAIGANNTNAFTSVDMTCYVEDIPSNELERWAMVESDRFKNPVLRGFHTELETIYEEKNMSLTNDSRKSYEKMLATLFPSHPYGTQTVLGTQTHLKNPSITNIKRYHEEWYVPNNMIIAMSGDFDPDEAVAVVARYFGDMKPNENLRHLTVKPEVPFTEPVREEVWGNDAESVIVAWRVPGASDEDMLVLDMIANVLSNGSAGLMDLDLNQAQKVLASGAYIYDMADQGAFIMSARPLEGQTLDEVTGLMLAELDKVRKGEFSDELLSAVKANDRLDFEQSMLVNSNRAQMFVNAFINGEPWEQWVADRERLKNLTKEDIVRVANKYLGEKNYASVAKRQGTPRDELKIAKPALTPIVTNRDTASTFLADLMNISVEPIEPQFVDFRRDLASVELANGTQLLYTHNPYNDLFDLTFVYETGSWADRYLSYAASYINLIGTKDMTPAQVREAFYGLACEFYVSVGVRRSYIVLRGLGENMTAALQLLEKLLADAVADPQVYSDFVDRQSKAMKDAKANQRQNLGRLSTYVTYGPEYVKERTVTEEELRSLDPSRLTESLHDLTSLTHRIIYYGPDSEKDVAAILDANHAAGVTLKDPEEFRKWEMIKPEETVVYVAPYDAKQLYMTMFTTDGKTFDPSVHPLASVYNEYFGGSMNSIVFQEMREARSLAYSAYAILVEPNNLDFPYTYQAQIATQNDKLIDAADAFNLIINDMPQSEAAFKIAKDGIESRLRTERTIDDNIAWAYIRAQDRGLAPSLDGNGNNRSAGLDLDRQLFEALPGITLDELVRYQQSDIKGKTYTYGILGKIEDLDMDALSRIGRVVILTPEDIFGY
ncbi:MAG: insulinase family protein [Bacteroidales bacterium]|nr:insulinase family protein [Bacteroidales bacterium]